MRHLTARQRKSKLRLHLDTHVSRLVREFRSHLDMYIMSNKDALIKSIGDNLDSRISPVIDSIPSHETDSEFFRGGVYVSLSYFNSRDPIQSYFVNGYGVAETLANLIEQTTDRGDFSLSDAYDKWFYYYSPLLARALGKVKIQTNPFLVDAYKGKALNFFSHSALSAFSILSHLLRFFKAPGLVVEAALVALFAPKKKAVERHLNIKTASVKVAQRYLIAKALEDDEKRDIYNRWHKLINMTQKELDDWGDNPGRLKASLNRQRAKEEGGIQSGYDSFRRIVRRKSKPLKDWSPQDFQNAQQEINFNSRMLGNNPGQPVNKDIMKSKWEISLLNWGHDPSKKNSPSYGKWKAWEDDHN